MECITLEAISQLPITPEDIFLHRHQDMREDLKLKPEWEEYTEKFAGGLIPSLCPIRNFIGGLFS